MTFSRRHNLSIPQGAESFFLKEAFHHRRILRQVEDHFTRWSYRPVLTPVFDYYENYRHLLDSRQEEHSYRFPDRSGELLMLRSDITLFLARQMGRLPLKDNRVYRVYYADSIIRHQEDEAISSEEFFQAGGELIGRKGKDGDLEMVVILHDLLESLQLPPWYLHIGSRKLLDALCGKNLDPLTAGRKLDIRDKEGLTDLFEKAGIPQASGKARLLLSLGTVEEYQQLCRTAPLSPEDTGAKEALEELAVLTQTLCQIIPKERIRVDLSEHGGQSYYTGFTLKAYGEGSPVPIASGGRYDKLLGALGNPAPAVGFSLLMRKIEPLSGLKNDPEATNPPLSLENIPFIEACRQAREIQKSGKNIILGKLSP